MTKGAPAPNQATPALPGQAGQQTGRESRQADGRIEHAIGGAALRGRYQMATIALPTPSVNP